MEEEVGPAGIKVPLRELANGNGHLEAGGQPEPQHNCRERHYKKWTIGLGVLSLVLIALAGTCICHLLQQKTWKTEAIKLESAVLSKSMCPVGWVGYGKKCYYFSEAEGNWTYSQSNCSSLGASLAVINTTQDLDFMVRHKGKSDHWIGLRRDLGQPWKWIDGTQFNGWFSVGADGDCAYLNDENKEKIQANLKILRKEREKLLGLKVTGEKRSQEYLKQTQNERQKIVSEFQQLQQFLQEQEQLLLAHLDKLDKEIVKIQDDNATKLSGGISHLSDLISEMEGKCQKPASEFLQDIRSTLKRCEKGTVQQPEEISPEVEKKLSDFTQKTIALMETLRKFKDTLPSALERRRGEFLAAAVMLCA